MPARLAIFVAQLGRKFRLFSLTMQRYKIFRSPPNFFAKKARKKARSRFLCVKVVILVIWSFVKIEIRHPQFRSQYNKNIFLLYCEQITEYQKRK